VPDTAPAVAPDRAPDAASVVPDPAPDTAPDNRIRSCRKCPMHSRNGSGSALRPARRTSLYRQPCPPATSPFASGAAKKQA